MSNKNITIKSMRGFEMSAQASLFEAKNWIYLHFTSQNAKGGRLCFDKDTLQIQKGQSYKVPEVTREELAKVAELF